MASAQKAHALAGPGHPTTRLTIQVHVGVPLTCGLCACYAACRGLRQARLT